MSHHHQFPTPYPLTKNTQANQRLSIRLLFSYEARWTVKGTTSLWRIIILALVISMLITHPDLNSHWWVGTLMSAVLPGQVYSHPSMGNKFGLGFTKVKIVQITYVKKDNFLAGCLWKLFCIEVDWFYSYCPSFYYKKWNFYKPKKLL